MIKTLALHASKVRANYSDAAGKLQMFIRTYVIFDYDTYSEYLEEKAPKLGREKLQTTRIFGSHFLEAKKLFK